MLPKQSKDVIGLGHQIITQDWWNKSKKDYDIYISDSVIDEISKGNKLYSRKRLEYIKKIKVLDADKNITKLMNTYMKYYQLSQKFELDITHIAYAVFYEMDYLLTWNCKHIANAHFRIQIANYNRKKGLHVPEICTPEELNNKWR